MNKYHINKGFIVQKLGKKTVIFDGEKSVLYTFNETASFIFNKLKAGWEKSKIIQELSHIYKKRPEKIKVDFNELISDLKRKKIVSSSNT
ncbi:hypothetical protein A3D78_01450 [Candidatus Gottesmanbacteria bacterium RIFCSPHIGHO2_02_FULL_39_14]|uniref:PqqD family protein n=1 Tax=Candidatus Gottesmanbacteria bacterium RIFCSPHIGHO2_02_FULL_39_14 TaxID=1798383 RepID=A0A1F5ZWN7_9BACT|nr:MAG: hypothetical protein A3D78_01450 [Candidatus Gottesmanbacteria bacterium RIFCSPHIGHO2_02_FULL_39_14]